MGGQRIFSFCQIYFLREGGVPEADNKRVEICVGLGCVFNFMMCLKVIYSGLIKTEIDNWNSDGYFHRACAICEKSWLEFWKNLVEHQIIKNDKRI